MSTLVRSSICLLQNNVDSDESEYDTSNEDNEDIDINSRITGFIQGTESQGQSLRGPTIADEGFEMVPLSEKYLICKLVSCSLCLSDNRLFMLMYV